MAACSRTGFQSTLRTSNTRCRLLLFLLLGAAPTLLLLSCVLLAVPSLPLPLKVLSWQNAWVKVSSSQNASVRVSSSQNASRLLESPKELPAAYLKPLPVADAKNRSGPCESNATLIYYQSRGSTRVDDTVTIVSTYYQVKSKRAHSKYAEWMRNTLLKIQSPFHIFTDCSTLQSASYFRDLLVERRKMMEGSVYIDLLNLEETDVSRQLGQTLRDQEKMDPERSLGHSFALYVIWLIKGELIRRASDTNIFGTEWYLYCDIGLLRQPDHPFRQWPSPARLKLLDKDRWLFEGVNPIQWGPKLDDVDTWLGGGRRGCFLIYGDHLAGGYIGANAVRNTTHTFFLLVVETFRLLASKGHLVVKDQVVYNTLFLRHPELFTVIPAIDYGGRWFYMHYWLANDQERGKAPNTVPITRNRY